jgi:hypothetical protein
MRATCLNPRGRGLNLTHIREGVRGYDEMSTAGLPVNKKMCQPGSTTRPR